MFKCLLPGLLLLFVATSCKDKKQPAEDLNAVEVPIRENPPPDPAPAKPGPPTVTLHEAGSEPRKELRYRPKMGAKQSVETTLQLAITTKLRGESGPRIVSPPIITRLETEVTRATANEFEYTFQIIEAKTDKGVKATVPTNVAVDKELETLVGLRGSATVDRRGFNLDAKIIPPKTMKQRIRQLVGELEKTLKNMSTPLPAEPVGVGAKWRVTQTIEQAGMSIVQHTDFELVAMEGDQIELQMALTQTAGRQPIRNPNVPPSAKLSKLAGTGSGKARLGLNRLAPLSSNVDIVTNTVLEVFVGNSGKLMETITEVDVAVHGE